MALRELLTISEKHMIEEYIDNYAVDGRARRTVDANFILREWADKKSQYLARIFGNQLILSKDVSYNRPTELISQDIYDTIICNWSSEKDAAAHEFYRAFRRRLVEDAIWSDRQIMYCLDHLIHNYTLAKNEYNYNECEIPLPSGKTLKLTKGARCTRLISKLAKAFDIEGFEAFRLAHSQCLNQKALKGELCLSIHPMDFMTMSDNDNDWESCMSWMNTGCYRQGTVEMMNSPMVVVAYLRSKDDMKICGGYNWNSKKWRELYIVTPDIISNVKGYPYCSDELSKTVIKWLKELVEKAGFSSYDEEPFEYDMGNRYDHPHKKDEFLTISMYTNIMYNDFGCGHWACLGTNIPTGRLDVTYSGASECMTCGRLGIYLDDGEEGRLCCDECNPYVRCAECGDAMYDEDSYEVDGEMLCSYCYDNCCFTDDLTGETHNNYRRMQIDVLVMKDDVPHIFSEHRIEIDEQTYNSEFVNKYLNGKRAKSVYWDWCNYHAVNIADLTEEGRKLFDVPSTEEGIQTMFEEEYYSSPRKGWSHSISDVPLF